MVHVTAQELSITPADPKARARGLHELKLWYTTLQLQGCNLGAEMYAAGKVVRTRDESAPKELESTWYYPPTNSGTCCLSLDGIWVMSLTGQWHCVCGACHNSCI